jgi:cell division protein FtsI (penicillin-binding protein 3)
MISSLRHTHHRRIVFLAVLALLGYAGIVARLAVIGVVRGEHYQRRAEGQHIHSVRVMPRRGEILDRRGRPLAVSVLRETLYVNCSAASEQIRRRVADACSEIFHRPADRYLTMLQGRGYVPVVRRIEDDEADRVRAFIDSLNLNSTDIVYLMPETKRLYPLDTVAASVIGHTRPDDTGDNEGVSGIEATWNKHLRGRFAASEVFHTAALQVMEPLGAEALTASAGHQVILTIDSVIQRVAEDALGDAVMRYQADWGTTVVLDPRTGDVLALANCPTHDLNHHADYPEAAKRDYAIMNPVDPGSVMKIFVFAAALEEGLIKEAELIDCHGGHWRHPLYGFSVTDDSSHRLGIVPMSEAFALSSNVATVQVADRLGAERLVAHLAAFGFGRQTGIDLPGESPGSLRPAGRWSTPDHRTIPTGQGVGLTALQTAAALSVIANRGIWQRPQIVSRIEDAAGQVIPFERSESRRRVISGLTARRMAALMEDVVTEGTGTEAQIEGFRVAGKTGTADRYDEQLGRYVGYVAGFAGFAPADDPRVVCVVYISNPNRRIGFYGGLVAAPVFQQIVSDSLRILGTPTEAPGLAPEAPAEMIIEAARGAPSDKPGQIAGGVNLPPERSGLAVMPDVMGLTMREVTRRMADADVSLRFQGTGRVVSQVPLPGTPLEGVSRAVVVFEDGERENREPQVPEPEIPRLQRPDMATATASQTPDGITLARSDARTLAP